jgi:hypothetical protein
MRGLKIAWYTCQQHYYCHTVSSNRDILFKSGINFQLHCRLECHWQINYMYYSSFCFSTNLIFVNKFSAFMELNRLFTCSQMGVRKFYKILKAT